MAQDAPNEIDLLRADLLEFMLAELAATDASGLRESLASSVTAEVERQLGAILPHWTLQIASDRDAFLTAISERVVSDLSSNERLSSERLTLRSHDDAVHDWSSCRPNPQRWKLGALIAAALAACLAGFGYRAQSNANDSAALATNRSVTLQAQCNVGQAIRQGLDQLGQPKKGLDQCDPAVREVKPSSACAAAMAIADGLNRFDRTCTSSEPAN
jgi:hypothetical protein